MSTRRVTIPTFLGGISQQSPAIRRGNLVEDAKNVEFLASEGATKRYPTKHVADLGEDLSGYRVWGLERDDDDYLLMFGAGDVKVFNTDGDEFIVDGDPSTYLSGAAYKDLQVNVIADTVFVLNKAKTVERAAGKVDWSADSEAGVFVKQSNYGIEYSIEFETDAMSGPELIQYTVPAAPVSTDGALPGTASVSAGQAGGTLPWVFDRGFNSADDIIFTRIRAATTDFTLSSADFTADPFTKEIFYIGSGDLVAGDDIKFEVAPGVVLDYFLSTANIARILMIRLEDRLSRIGNASFTIETDGNESSSFRVATTEDLTKFEVRDSQAGDYMSGWTDRVTQISALPLVFKHGAVVRITGEDSDRVNDYYVAFATDEWATATDSDYDQFDSYSGFGQGTWNETVKRGLADGSFDAATMPHILKRTADTDGSITGTVDDIYFKWSEFDWSDRGVGDENTNREPSFVGDTINDIFSVQNRLGLLSATEVSLSESGEQGNFWRTTTLSVQDSDRIDFSASDLAGDTLRHAVPFNRGFLVFSELGQAAVTGSPFLTPSTVQAPMISGYRAFGDVPPVLLGQSLFFGYAAGQHAAIREFIPSRDDSNAVDENIITLAVPRLIPSEIERISVGSVDQTVGVLPTSRDKIYIYQFLRIGQEQLQASWTTWEFDAEIQDMVFMDSRLMVLLTRGGTTYLEQIDLGPGRTATGTDFVIRVDSQAPVTDASYDRPSDRTTFVSPYSFTADEPLILVANTGGTLKYGAEVNVVDRNVGLNTVKVKGDLTGQPFLIGRPYDATLVLSKPLVKVQRGGGETAILGGTTTIRDLWLSLTNTGYLKATCQYIDFDSAEDEFLAEMIDVGRFQDSLLTDGEFQVGIHADVTDFRVTLSSTSALPFTVVNGAWDTRFTVPHAIG